MLRARPGVGFALVAPTKSATWRPTAALDTARALFSGHRGDLYLQPEEGFEPWEPAPDYYAVLRRAYAQLGFDRKRLAAAARVAA